MHDAEVIAVAIAELVRVVQGVRRLLHDRADEAQVEHRGSLRRAPQQRQQRDALHVLHHDVELTVGLAELVHLADVAVRHLRSDARLGDQHLTEPRVVREVRQDALHDEQLLETLRTFEPGQEDLAHAARRQASEQLVAAESSGRPCGRHSHSPQW